MQSLYLGLVHYPITNKSKEMVTTSVTNLDIHDIARSCRTFGVKKYFIVTPLKAQHELVNRILTHWNSSEGLSYNPDRKDALSYVELSESVEKMIDQITILEGKRPLIVVTGANFKDSSGDIKALKQKLEIDKVPCLLIFGTGWGLHALVIEQADFRLSPIIGFSDDGYNHLSVRSAVAIYLDRFRQGL